MNAPELAELNESVLDAATLDALVSDLQTHADVLDVLVKGAATQRTDGKPVPLTEAVEMMRAGSVRGVQVRYNWDGDEWRDTLFAVPGGVRLVRMKIDFR